MPTYRRQPVAFVRGEGAALYDAEGRRFVDCMAGISMNNVGHCHPAVVAAIAEQAGRLINVSNLYYTEPMIALAEWIRDRSLGRPGLLLQLGRRGQRGGAQDRPQARRPGPPRGRRAGRRLPRAHLRRAVAHRPALQAGRRSGPWCPACATSTATTWRASRPRSRTAPARSCSRSCRARCGVHPVPQPMLELARELARPPRRAADDRRDPDRPVAHRAAVRPPGRRRGARRDDARQEPRRRRADRRRGGAARSTTRSCSPATTARPSPPGPLACAAALASCAVLDDAALQAWVRRKGADLLAGLEGLVADGLATEARGRGLMCAIDLPRPRARRRRSPRCSTRASWSTTLRAGPIRMLPPLVIDPEDLDALVGRVPAGAPAAGGRGMIRPGGRRRARRGVARPDRRVARHGPERARCSPTVAPGTPVAAAARRHGHPRGRRLPARLVAGRPIDIEYEPARAPSRPADDRAAGDGRRSIDDGEFGDPDGCRRRAQSR